MSQLPLTSQKSSEATENLGHLKSQKTPKTVVSGAPFSSYVFTGKSTEGAGVSLLSSAQEGEGREQEEPMEVALCQVFAEHCVSKVHSPLRCYWVPRGHSLGQSSKTGSMLSGCSKILSAKNKLQINTPIHKQTKASSSSNKTNFLFGL